MNQQQYERIFDIFKADCKTTGSLIDNEGRTCAIGALFEDLAAEVGVVIERDEETGSAYITEAAHAVNARLGGIVAEDEREVDVYEVIHAHYGLATSTIVSANDGQRYSIIRRRRAVLEELNNQAWMKDIELRLIPSADELATGMVLGRFHPFYFGQLEPADGDELLGRYANDLLLNGFDKVFIGSGESEMAARLSAIEELRAAAIAFDEKSVSECLELSRESAIANVVNHDEYDPDKECDAQIYVVLAGAYQ